MDITIEQMPKLLKNKDKIRREYAKLQKELTGIVNSYNKRIKSFEDKIDVIDRVTNFWDKNPVCIKKVKNGYGEEFYVIVYSDNLRKVSSSQIYPDARTSVNGQGKHWHIRYLKYFKYETKETVFMLFLESPAKALEAVENYVLRGIEFKVGDHNVKF